MTKYSVVRQTARPAEDTAGLLALHVSSATLTAGRGVGNNRPRRQVSAMKRPFSKGKYRPEAVSGHYKMGAWSTRVVPLALSLRSANVNSSQKPHVKGIVVMVHNPLIHHSFAVNTALYISGTGSPRNFTHQNAKSYKTTR